MNTSPDPNGEPFNGDRPMARRTNRQRKDLVKLLTRRQVLQIIAAEPELPGPPPPAFAAQLEAACAERDIALLLEFLRAAIRKTKNNIALKINEL